MQNKTLPLFKTLGTLLALSILFALSTAAAMAASYPSKPARIIAPYAPGGSSDILGRLIAASLYERLKWLKAKHGRIEPVPVDSINWKTICDASIRRHPPFTLDAKNPDIEKGFRDLSA